MIIKRNTKTTAQTKVNITLSFKSVTRLVLALILTLTLTALTLVACGTEADVVNSKNSSGADISDGLSQTASESTSSQGVDSSEEDYLYGSNLEVKNLQGRVINVLCRDWGGFSIQGYNGEIIQREDFDEKEADAVDIAKYEVRKLIEERYNCKIKGSLDKSAPVDFNNKVRNMVHGGTKAYDIVFDAYGHSNPLVTEGIYIDLYSVDSIDFSNPWWDQNAVKDLSICNKLFFACGDINTYDNDGTWVLYFNKQLLAKTLPDINLYNLVENNQWTFDKFAEICKFVSSDTDGIDGMNEFDTWGLGTETYNVYVHVIASGQKICQKNNDDEPYFSYQTESMYNVLDDVLDLYLDDSKVMVANGGKYNHYTNVWDDTIIKAFREGRELFYMGGLINAVSYRQLEFSYGILPIPKYLSSQDNYNHSVSFHNMSCMMIPKGESEEEYYELGLVIEALGAESKNYLTPVYYEKALKAKNADTEEDEAMLDIIFNSRCFDLGAAFNWGNIISEFMKLDVNFVSRFDSTAESIKQAMENTIEAIKNNN